MTERLYKVLDKDGQSCNGGDMRWSLPVKNADGTWTPGEWMPPIQGELIPCKNGYHLCRATDLLSWLNARIFVAEHRGDLVEAGDKVVVREARLLHECEQWNERTARLFACWCVRHTPLADGRTVWELLMDERSKHAVEVAERYAIGEASYKELAVIGTKGWAAAMAAAGDRAWALGSDPAGDAARSGDPVAVAEWVTAAVAAWAAAKAAAGDAVGGAAWDAARKAAGEAAWAAACDGTREASRNAAYTIAFTAQLEELQRIMDI